MPQDIFSLDPQSIQLIQGKVQEVITDLETQNNTMTAVDQEASTAMTGAAATGFRNAMGRWFQVFTQMRTELTQIKEKVDAASLNTQNTDDQNMHITTTLGG